MRRNIPRKDRHAFRPSLGDSPLEVRIVPSTTNQALAITPDPAPPPMSPAMTIARIRMALVRQASALISGMRPTIQGLASQLTAGGTPTAQQVADFNAQVAGMADAAALRLSGQAALLPGTASRLIPAIQNALIGNGSSSLISRVRSLAASGNANATASALQGAINQQLSTSLRAVNSQIANYFNTTNLRRLSVSPTGARIPLRQFMAGQLLNQLGNTLGSLSQNFSSVSTSALFPNGLLDANGQSIVPTQTALSAFNVQAGNALQTAAFLLGNGLSVFPGTSQVVSQIQSSLFGTGANSTSLASALNNLQFGSSGLNSAVTTAFNNTFQNVTGALNPFLRVAAPSNTTLPTAGFTSLFGPDFTSSSFASGFNNGFATAPSTGFIGFGQAPTTFNTNFGTGFNSLVSSVNTGFGLGTSLL